jgi:hypothetical protein
MSADPTPGDDAAGDRGLGRRGRKLLATMPHIIAYPGADYVLAPYVNCALRPGMDTGTIRADAYGYRVTHDPHGIVDSRTWLARPRRALALGNSFLLGWCCSGDAATIPSYLSAKTPYSFLNLGLAGASSLQETIAGIPFLDQAELVVIISGIGNVQHYLEHTRDYDLYGAFFSQHLYLGTSQTPVRQLSALHQQDTSADVGLARERLARHAAAHAVPKQQWSAAEVRERHDLAVQHHFRDLRLLRRALNPGTHLLYALQPVSCLAKPVLEPDEVALHAALHRMPMWKDIFEPYVIPGLPDYIDALRRNCEALGVPCVDLSQVDYRGFCFVDYVHTTDTANEQIADYLAERLPA